MGILTPNPGFGNVVWHAAWRNTIAPLRAEPGPRGCRSSATPPTASEEWTSFGASRSRFGATVCWWSWTSSRAALSASAGSAAPSPALTFAACSTRPFTDTAFPSVPTMIRCLRRTAGLIATVRRECLDHVPFWNAHDLERKLGEFQVYYNAARSHASLDGYTPLTYARRNTVSPADLNRVRWVSHCRGLVQLPVAA
jgi:hypothetical protein